MNFIEMPSVEIFRENNIANTQPENILNHSLSLFSEKIPRITEVVRTEPSPNHEQILGPPNFAPPWVWQFEFEFHRSVCWFWSRILPTTKSRYMPDICPWSSYVWIHMVYVVWSSIAQWVIVHIGWASKLIPMDPLMNAAHCHQWAMTMMAPMIRIIMIVAVLMGDSSIIMGAWWLIPIIPMILMILIILLLIIMLQMIIIISKSCHSCPLGVTSPTSHNLERETSARSDTPFSCSKAVGWAQPRLNTCWIWHQLDMMG